MLERALLVTMPFADIEYPSLALGLLKRLVQREGVSCDVKYLNIAFGSFIGRPDICIEVAQRGGALGEWPFGEELFGEAWARSDRGCPEATEALVRPGDSGLRAVLDNIVSLRPMAGPFIRQCLDTVNWGDYGIIGFTSVFSQQVASLALARRIKERWPDKIIAFGGPNCDGVMGRALLRLFPFVDWVFNGEADVSFPRAVARWFAGRAPEGIRGVAYRRNGEIVEQGSGEPPDLDSLLYPDFDDYFAALEKWVPVALPSASVVVEFSRGCWWGEKSQCLFCGVNGSLLRFRHKSPQRAADEVKALVERHGIRKVRTSDRILSMSFFSTLLPILAEGVAFSFETKANLSREQVCMLKAAGTATFQPGVESLDTEMLAHMRKGTTLLQNVQLLKWAREYGLYAIWNLLYGFPGENPEAYQRMARLLPLMVHLQPPESVAVVSLERFSPLFSESEKRGLRDVRASAIYQLCYPFGQQDLDELVWSFDCDFDGKDRVSKYVGPAKSEAEAWRKLWDRREPPLLAFERQRDGKIVIYDTRPCRAGPTVELEGEMAMAYLACDARRRFDSLAKEVQEKAGKGYCGDTALRRGLDGLVGRRLMLREGDRYLSLANDLDVLGEYGSSMVAWLLASKP